MLRSSPKARLLRMLETSEVADICAKEKSMPDIFRIRLQIFSRYNGV